ncbi:hypothetical protein ACP4OV_014626 [Aristida adscensionis]
MPHVGGGVGGGGEGEGEAHGDKCGGGKAHGDKCGGEASIGFVGGRRSVDDAPRTLRRLHHQRWPLPHRAPWMTLAAARNSRGHPVTACLHLAPPPALSRVRVRVRVRVRCCLPPAAVHRHRRRTTTVVSVHGGSVLLRVAPAACSRHPGVTEYFIYDAGAAGGGTGPPSLCLLPSPSSSVWKKRWPDMSSAGRAEAAVAQLRSATRRGLMRREEIHLHLFRSGKWRVERPRIIRRGHDRKGGAACGCRPRGAPRPPCPSPAGCCAGSTCTAASR